MKTKSGPKNEPKDSQPVKPALLREGSVVFLSAEAGNPVISVTDSFLRYTGYERHEVLGRDLEFLNGPDTAPEAIEMFRYLRKTEIAGQVKILNYTKTGQTFWHMCDLRPIRNVDQQITHFICVLRVVSPDID